MCAHGFQGKGYSPEFVDNFWRVVELMKDGDVEIEVVAGVEDRICGPCPNNLEASGGGNGVGCVQEPKIRKLDDAYVATLGVRPGDVLRWKDVKQLVVRKVTDEAFDRNCEPCNWRKLGVCKDALQSMREKLGGSKLMLLASIVGLLVGGVPSAQAAQKQVTALAAMETAKTSLTIDQLEQRLLANKELRIPAIRKVQEALNNLEWKKALDAAKQLETHAEFSDYYHYFVGQAELGRLKEFRRQDATATALLAAEQARFHLSQVQGSNPYTTLWRKANVLLGEVELLTGEMHLQTMHREKGQQFLENGFQRLSQSNLLALVPKATIVSYALLCEKKSTSICVSWVAKLGSYMGKGDEARSFERMTNFKRPYIERSPQQPYKVDVDLQAFQNGFQQYLAGKYEEAFSTWKALLTEYPRTSIKLRTKFWMGRAAQKSNHTAEAETLYREIIKELPFSYYALLASWLGGIDLSRMMDAELPSAITETPLLTPSDVVHIKRAEMLIASAVPELAALELQDVRPSLNMPNEFVVYLVALNHLAGNHSAAFQMLGELATRNFKGLFSVYGQKLYFPTTRLPLIRSVADESKVDPLLMISIVKQESAFNSEAMSGANAYGLMQLIAPTARDMDPKVEVGELFQPLTNLKLGGKYIRQLLGRYKGNVVAALAAYNAGPGNSDRWMREAAANMAPEEFIETIGFRETREYVQNIARNYYWYHKRVKGEPISGFSALMSNFALQSLPQSQSSEQSAAKSVTNAKH